MKLAYFASNLTDDQWKFLEPMLPKPAKRGRPSTNLRVILDGIFYVNKTGIPWRYLPTCFPPWQTVYGYFWRWQQTDQWAVLQALLRELVRRAAGKAKEPTAAILDSQTVKVAAGHDGTVGYDAAKRINGRKRHILVDTMGLLLDVMVTPADVTEREGGQSVLARACQWFAKLRCLWVDGGYAGTPFAQWVKKCQAKLKVEVVKRSDKKQGFHVLPRRWVVERTFGWLMQYRRLARDYEKTTSSAEAMIHIAMIQIQLKRLA